jgi:hypothetical protein
MLRLKVYPALGLQTRATFAEDHQLGGGQTALLPAGAEWVTSAYRADGR